MRIHTNLPQGLAFKWPLQLGGGQKMDFDSWLLGSYG